MVNGKRQIANVNFGGPTADEIEGARMKKGSAGYKNGAADQWELKRRAESTTTPPPY